MISFRILQPLFHLLLTWKWLCPHRLGLPGWWAGNSWPTATEPGFFPSDSPVWHTNINPKAAAITIAPPAYVLFPFDDPFDGMDTLSTSPVFTIPVLPGFAPIGPPRSLATPPVIMDMLSRDFPSPGLSVSLLLSGLLSPCRVQPILEETSAVRHTWSLSVSIPAGESPDREFFAAGCYRTGRAFISGCVDELPVESPVVVTGLGAVGWVLL